MCIRDSFYPVQRAVHARVALAPVALVLPPVPRFELRELLLAGVEQPHRIRGLPGGTVLPGLHQPGAQIGRGATTRELTRGTTPPLCQTSAPLVGMRVAPGDSLRSVAHAGG